MEKTNLKKTIITNQSMDSVCVESQEDYSIGHFSHHCPTYDRTNQDSIGILITKKRKLLIIADGIGGHRGGAQASKLAVETLIDQLEKSEDFCSYDLIRFINKSNNQIKELNIGAGTTLTAALIEGEQVTFFCTGDSPAFIFSGKGNLKFQTLDQSCGGLAKSSGLFNEKEIQNKQGQNQLIYALGDEYLNLMISGPVTLNARDSILLCSDGLSANLSSTEITNIVTSGPTIEKMNLLKESTMKKMNDPLKGKPDDLSIIFYDMQK